MPYALGGWATTDVSLLSWAGNALERSGAHRAMGFTQRPVTRLWEGLYSSQQSTIHRHRLLGNAWHLQVAKFMLMILILLQSVHLAAADVPMPPRETSLQMVCRLARAEHHALGTRPPFLGQLFNIDKLTIFGTIGRYHLNVVTLCWHHLTSNQVSCRRCTSVFHCSLGCVSRLSRRSKTWLRHGRRWHQTG